MFIIAIFKTNVIIDIIIILLLYYLFLLKQEVLPFLVLPFLFTTIKFFYFIYVTYLLI